LKVLVCIIRKIARVIDLGMIARVIDLGMIEVDQEALALACD